MKFPKLIFHLNNISITKYFLTFAFAIIFLTAFTYFYLSQKIYSEKVLVTLENQSSRIEKSLVDNIEYSAYLMKYLGDQIKNKNSQDLKHINHLLSSFGLKSSTDNETPWNMFSWVNKDMEVVVNSSLGIINPISINNREYAPLTVSQPEIIHMGKASFGRVSGEWIIPAGMGFVDKNQKYIGAIVFGFQINKLAKRLWHSTTEPNISFAVFDYEMDQVLNSDNFSSTPEFNHIISRALLNPHQHGQLTNFSFLGNNENYGYFQKLDKYPYILITRIDATFSKRETLSHFYPYLFEICTIFTILAIILYVLKVAIISPIVQLSRVSKMVAEDSDEEVVMPESHVLEIVELTQQVKLIERYKLKLLQAKKSQERFFANMSHELRTPLNGILNFSMMMKKEMFGPLDAEYKEMANDIHSSGSHLLNLVNDILDFSKMDIGKMNLHEEEFDMSEEVKVALKIVLSDVDSYDENSAVKIISEIEIKNANFRGDRRMFKQILLNLLSNASKFVDKGSITLRLFLNQDNNIELKIEDTGIGIKEEDLNKLAVEFGQVGDGYYRGKKQGSGLGLFLVKKMAELHQGSFEIASVYGKGTTVRVIFPGSRLISI